MCIKLCQKLWRVYNHPILVPWWVQRLLSSCDMTETAKEKMFSFVRLSSHAVYAADSQIRQNDHLINQWVTSQQIYALWEHNTSNLKGKVFQFLNFRKDLSSFLLPKPPQTDYLSFAERLEIQEVNLVLSKRSRPTTKPTRTSKAHKWTDLFFVLG